MYSTMIFFRHVICMNSVANFSLLCSVRRWETLQWRQQVCSSISMIRELTLAGWKLLSLGATGAKFMHMSWRLHCIPFHCRHQNKSNLYNRSKTSLWRSTVVASSHLTFGDIQDLCVTHHSRKVRIALVTNARSKTHSNPRNAKTKAKKETAWGSERHWSHSQAHSSVRLSDWTRVDWTGYGKKQQIVGSLIQQHLGW